MSIETVEQYPTQELNISEKGKITGRKQWYVKTSNNIDPEGSILAHPDIPNKNAPYSASYPGVRAKQIKVISSRRNEDNAYHWDVIVDYDNMYDSSKDNANPLDEPAKIRISNEYRDKIIYADEQTGDDIKNSALEPTPIITRESFTKLTWIKNVASFDYALLNIVNTVNDGVITIDGEDYADQLAYCASLDVTEDLEQDQTVYRTIQAQFLIANDPVDKWKRVLLNQSKRSLDNKGEVLGLGLDPEYSPIQLPGTGKFVSSPWPLDADGLPLNIGVGAQQFTYEKWNEYDKEDWSGLGLA